jgi:adenylate cyclase class IV
MEVSLKYNHPIGDHFEAEMICHSEKDLPKATERLQNFLRKFGFSTWTPEDYKKIIKDTAYKNPYIDFDEGIKLLQ